jgi:hypothetical protein
MMIEKRIIGILVLVVVLLSPIGAQEFNWKDYNVSWTTQSKNSSESMPAGGGEIG